MISFHPCAWDDGFREWLYSDIGLLEDALTVEMRIKAGGAALMVAYDRDRGVVGLLVASGDDAGYLMIEAVAGEAMVMRAAIEWSKEMVRLLGLSGARAYTRRAGVVYHMARAGACLGGAYLSWEA